MGQGTSFSKSHRLRTTFYFLSMHEQCSAQAGFACQSRAGSWLTARNASNEDTLLPSRSPLLPHRLLSSFSALLVLRTHSCSHFSSFNVTTKALRRVPSFSGSTPPRDSSSVSPFLLWYSRTSSASATTSLETFWT